MHNEAVKENINMPIFFLYDGSKAGQQKAAIESVSNLC